MILLHSGPWHAELSPEYGMNTLKLTYEEENILRSPAAPADLEKSACVYGTPILLPPNRTADGRFSFAGKTYFLPVNEPAFQNHIHGLLNRAAFHIFEQDRTHAVGTLENHGEYFPFPFRITVRCRLTEAGYFQRFCVENIGETAMPLAFGLHTTFTEPDFFSVPIGGEWEQDHRHIPTGKLLPLGPRQQKYRSGMSPDGQPTGGFFTAEGHSARLGKFSYTVSDNFNQWTLWNGGGKTGFLSVEPQCGAVNALNSGEGLIILSSGETEIFDTQIRKI